MRAADRCEFHLANRVDSGLVDLVKREYVHVRPPLDGKPLDTTELQVRVVGEEVGHCPVDSMRSCTDGWYRRSWHVGSLICLLWARCLYPFPVATDTAQVNDSR